MCNVYVTHGGTRDFRFTFPRTRIARQLTVEDPVTVAGQPFITAHPFITAQLFITSQR